MRAGLSETPQRPGRLWATPYWCRLRPRFRLPSLSPSCHGFEDGGDTLQRLGWIESARRQFDARHG